MRPRPGMLNSGKGDAASVRRAYRLPRMAARPGFTLAEVIMVAALFLVIGGGLLTAFLTGQSSYFSADAYVQVQEQARRALDVMVRELREAGPVSGASVMQATAIVSNTNQLNFEVALGYNSPSAACNGVCWGENNVVGNWVHYGVITTAALGPNSRQLIRCVDGARTTAIATCAANNPGTVRVLANNVTSASATLDNAATPRVVTINLRLQYQNPRLAGGSQTLGTAASPLVTQVRLRNAS